MNMFNHIHIYIYMCMCKKIFLYVYIYIYKCIYTYRYLNICTYHTHSYTRWHNIVQYTVGNKHRLMAYIICNCFDKIDLFYLSERLQGMKHMYHLFSSCPTCGVQEHTGPKKKKCSCRTLQQLPFGHHF